MSDDPTGRLPGSLGNGPGSLGSGLASLSNGLSSCKQRRDARIQREWRSRFYLSIVGHVAVVLLFAFTPSTSRPALPHVVTVDLVASIPSAAPKAAAAKPKSAPKPVPPQAKPAPPPPQAKKVLPKVAPKAVPKRKPKPKLKPRPEELDLDDALDQLRDDLGETADDVSVQELLDSVQDAGPQAAERTGTPGDAEFNAWQVAVTQHLQSRWITPPEFLNRGLRTELSVTLLSDGTVIDVVVTRSSGDAFADDNAVRALQKANPLPKPPKPGNNTFVYVPEIRP